MNKKETEKTKTKETEKTKTKETEKTKTEETEKTEKTKTEAVISAFLFKCELLTGKKYQISTTLMAELWGRMFEKTDFTVKELINFSKNTVKINNLISYSQFINMLEETTVKDNAVDTPQSDTPLLDKKAKEAVQQSYERKPVVSGMSND